jgi:hypothetical protein
MLKSVAVPQFYAENRLAGAIPSTPINDEGVLELPPDCPDAHRYVRPRSGLEMDQSSPNWIGPVVFFVWLLICLWGLRRFNKLQRRYINAIANITGHRVRGIHRSLGDPSIYTKGSKARRLQKAYLFALYRLQITLIILVLGWMFLGGWLLVSFSNLLLAVFSG